MSYEDDNAADLWTAIIAMERRIGVEAYLGIRQYHSRIAHADVDAAQVVQDIQERVVKKSCLSLQMPSFTCMSLAIVSHMSRRPSNHCGHEVWPTSPKPIGAIRTEGGERTVASARNLGNMFHMGGPFVETRGQDKFIGLHWWQHKYGALHLSLA